MESVDAPALTGGVTGVLVGTTGTPGDRPGTVHRDVQEGGSWRGRHLGSPKGAGPWNRRGAGQDPETRPSSSSLGQESPGPGGGVLVLLQ